MGQVWTNPTTQQQNNTSYWCTSQQTPNVLVFMSHAIYWWGLFSKCAWLPYVPFDLHWNWLSFIYPIVRLLFWQWGWNPTPTVLTTSLNSTGCSWAESHLFNHRWGICTNTFIKNISVKQDMPSDIDWMTQESMMPGHKLKHGASRLKSG